MCIRLFIEIECLQGVLQEREAHKNDEYDLDSAKPVPIEADMEIFEASLSSHTLTDKPQETWSKDIPTKRFRSYTTYE